MQETLKEYQKRIDGHPADEKRLLLVRDESVETTKGGIVLSEDAQRVPVSGVVIDAIGKYKTLIGSRVYFRPYAETLIPLGPGGEGPMACFIHYGDVMYVEEVPE